ncbi:MAG TPA: hypothetical protein VGI70_17910, partial [Polyangiales bacterium]
FSTPDHLRTSFVIVERDGRWLIMHVHNTFVGSDLLASKDPEPSDLPTTSDGGGEPVSQADDEVAVRGVVDAFYAEQSYETADFATDDWNSITPDGAWNRGRAATLVAFQTMFSKDATMTLADVNVRFANDRVAIVTATCTLGSITLDGIEYDNVGVQATLVLVKRGANGC